MRNSKTTTMRIINLHNNEKPQTYQQFHKAGFATSDIIVEPVGKHHCNMTAVKHL